MNGKKRRLLYILLGLCAGVTGFALVELAGRMNFSGYLGLSLVRGAVMGLIFGFIFGFIDGFLYKEVKSGLFKGAVAGITGGLVSAGALTLSFQGMLWTANIFKLEYTRTMEFIFPVWRSIGWMLMGTAIGMVDGIYQHTFRRGLAGMLGGLAGGLLGGLCVEFLPRFIKDPGIARAAGFAVMGVFIGFFLGEFERRFAYARIMVLNGGLKGREYLLIKKRTTLEENRQADIYLHGYGSIPEGVITRKKGEVFFSEGGSAGAEKTDGLINKVRKLRKKDSITLINDLNPAEKQPLKYQDVIQLGGLKLLYLPL